VNQEAYCTNLLPKNSTPRKIMHTYKADAAIINEQDFEEIEKGCVYIDREGGFVAIAEPGSKDVLLVEIDRSHAE
jgi:hypothetical protein